MPSSLEDWTATHHFGGLQDQEDSFHKAEQAQEDRFEALTKKLQAERSSLSSLHQPPSGQSAGSQEGSVSSITATDDSFHYRGSPPSPAHDLHLAQHQQRPEQEHDKLHARLLDNSLVRDQESQGTLNSGYISGPMDYMQDDPYSGHHLSSHDPYYSGGGGGGGGYPSNTSFDRHSEHSMHSDRNRMNSSELANGSGPPGSHLYHPNEGSPLPPSHQDPDDGKVPRYNGGVHYPEDTYGYQPGEQQHAYPAEDPYNDSSYAPQHADRPGSSQQYDPYPGDAHPNDSFRGGPGDPYDPHSSGRFEGLPPVSSDPFAEDPFREQRSRESEQQLRAPEDPYYPGSSPVGGGPEPVPYDDRGPPYDDRGPPYDDRGPPYDDRGPPYDDRGPPSQIYNDDRAQPYDDRNQPYNDRNPPYDDRNQPYDDRTQPYDDRNQPYDDRSQPYDDRNQIYNDRNQPHDDRTPQFDDRAPQYDDRAPPYDDRNQPYEDRGPQFDERGVPYDDRNQPYEDRGPQFDERAPPYDERDGPDPYSQSAPRYPQDYPVEDPSRQLEQLHLGAPPLDGRRTPSLDGRHLQQQQSSGLPTRYPDLQEVIDFLSSPDHSVQASAAAHLQHITYMDDSVKAKTRSLGGLRPLIRLLGHELVEVHKNACGALQNLSYGKTNNDNKREIKNEGGIPELIRLLRKTDQEDVRESVTGILWNLSSCEDLKQAIIEDGLTVLVNSVILRHSGWGNSQLPWTAVCRNTTGILRNVSSAGFDSRKRLRECRGLVNDLISMLKLAAEDEGSEAIDNKVVENIVCILRNLSYRIQEVVDPDFYKKRTLPRQSAGQGKAGKGGKGSDGPGCFGSKSGKTKGGSPSKTNSNQQGLPPPQLPPGSVEYRALWGPQIHSLYSTVLKRCTNPITMEAAAGAIQNLTACDWQPAVESRAMVRKEKGLPLLVDLLSAESDRVVCATATALRNLAIDDKNKDLVGKYAIRQLVSRLPRDNRNNLPDDTICAVVATLYEVVKDNQSFALVLVQEDGLRCLMHINNSQGRYLARTLKFTSTLLKTLWGYKSLHMEYAKQNYGQADFTTFKSYPRQDGSRPPDMGRTPTSSTQTTPYNTLSRPMSGQGYDDSTLSPSRGQHISRPPPDTYQAMNRSNASLHDGRSYDRLNYSRERIPQEDIPMNYMGPGYAPLDEPRPHRTKPPVGGVPLFPNLGPADPPSSQPYGSEDLQEVPEPLYAQVNKGGRRRNDYAGSESGGPRGGDYGSQSFQLNSGGPGAMDGGADSWV